MANDKTIRESELAELIGMALQLQEIRAVPDDHRLSEREVVQIGENIGIPAQSWTRRCGRTTISAATCFGRLSARTCAMSCCGR
jgi:hypothetical protein